MAMPYLRETTDYIALIVVMLEIIYMSVITNLLLIKRIRNYIPVIFQDKKNLVIMIVSGIIHSICALLINEHLTLIEDYGSKLLCISISVWIQYGLALNTWVMCLIYRMVNYGKYFTGHMFCVIKRKEENSYTDIELDVLTSDLIDKEIDDETIRMKYDIAFNYEKWLILSPIFFSIPFIVYPYTQINDETLCRLDTYTKYLIGMWCIICVIVVIFINKKLAKIKLSEAFHQYKPINAILYVGSITITINLITHFYGLWYLPTLRLISTSSICILHITSVHALIGKRIYHAIKSDHIYSLKFIKSHEWKRRISLCSPERCNEIEGFIDFCKKNYKLVDFRTSKLTLAIITLLDLLNKFNKEESIPFNNSDDTHKEKKRVFNSHFEYGSSNNVCIMLANYLINKMDDSDFVLKLAIDPVNALLKTPPDILKDYLLDYLDDKFGVLYDEERHTNGINNIVNIYKDDSVFNTFIRGKGDNNNSNKYSLTTNILLNQIE